MLAGVLLRIRFHLFPQQLATHQQQPGLMTAAYARFATGNVLLWPAVVALARRIGATHPGWAMWAGCLVMVGLLRGYVGGGGGGGGQRWTNRVRCDAHRLPPILHS